MEIRSTVNSTQGYKAHSHSQLSIGIISSGGTCSTINQQKIQLNEGDMILIAPNTVHSCNPIGEIPRSYHMLYIDNNWCCDLLSALYQHKVTQLTCEQKILSDHKITAELLPLISNLIENETSESIYQVELILFQIISRYCSPAELNVQDNLVYQVKINLLDNIIYPTTLSEISQEFNLSPETIIRRFKQCFGITPKSFLNNHRIEKAKLLLRSGMQIVDVANEVGYSDQSQLHRAFVHYCAATPRQYQQSRSIFDNNL